MSRLSPDNRDVNFFYESQLNTYSNTWDLIAWPDNKDSDGSTSKVKILSGIMSDTSFVVSGRNEFSSDSSNKLVNTVKDLAHTAQEYYNSASEAISIGKGVSTEFFENGIASAVNAGLEEAKKILTDNGNKNKAVGTVIDIARKSADLVGSRMITAFDYIKVFRNTELQFGIPTLNTRIIYDVPYISEYRVNDDVTFDLMYREPNLVVSHLLKYFIGGDETIEEKVVDKFISLQKSPLGYSPRFNLPRTPDDIIGTFTLRYGNYKIPGLLVSGFSYNVSNIRVRAGKTPPTSMGNKGSYHNSHTQLIDVPLYADISIDLMPSTYISTPA